MKYKIKSMLLACTMAVSCLPFSWTSANAAEVFTPYNVSEYTSNCFYDDIYCNDVDYNLWDKFIKYDLRITNYNSLTEKERDLCRFIFETERSANQTVRCERARRILAGDDVGKRITLEQLEGTTAIFDSEYKKLAASNAIECVPDIMHLDMEIDTNEYWLDDLGNKRILFGPYKKTFAYIELIDEVMDENREKWYRSYMVENGRDVYSESYDTSEEIIIGRINTDEGYYTMLCGNAVDFSGFAGKFKEKGVIVPETFNNYSVYSVSGFTGSDIVEIQLPQTLQRISDYAFSECPLIENIDINCPEAKIGKFAFYNSALKTAVITANIVDENAFHYCKELKKVTLNEGVEVVEANAFLDCENLTNIAISSTVKTIGQGAFLNTSINSVTIPKTVEIIGTFPKRTGYSSSAVSDYPATDPLTDTPKCSFDSDCTINGWYDTEAHSYAIEWGLKFNPLDENIAYGDLNADNSIDIADAVLMYSYISGHEVTVGFEADLTKDGIIDAFDMAAMRKRLVSNR